MITPPIEPMLAKPIGSSIPDDVTGLSFEPKWDGFRCLVFRSHDGVVLQGRGRSRSQADEVIDLAYAFPEIVESCLRQLTPGTVLDAEIVVAHEGRLDFTVLSSRLRPRSEAGGTNIARLAETHPASLLTFDLLWLDGDLRNVAFGERRDRLTALATEWNPPLHLTPNTADAHVANAWFRDFEAAGVDGIMVKALADPYTEGKRTQGKVKHQRTVDAVVAGWRPHARPGADGQDVVGSLLLGLFDAQGRLQYMGAASAFTAKVRAELVDLLAPLAVDDDAHPWRASTGVRVPGEANRWKKEQAWHAVRPELVAEVTYDQLEAGRFRHVAGFVRWRPDRTPESCTDDQIDHPPTASVDDLFPGGLTPGS